MKARLTPFLLALAACAAPAPAGGTRADYDRARALPDAVKGKVTRADLVLRWFGDGAQLAYSVDAGGGRLEFFEVDCLSGQRRPASGPVPPVERPSRTAPPTRGGSDASPRSERSPDGHWTVVLRDHNLVLRARDGGEEFPLTEDGAADDGYSPRVAWSPDSSRFVAFQTRKPQGRTIPLVESSPKDQLQPRLHSVPYDKPGDPLPVTRPRLFDTGRRARIPVDEKLFATPWSIDRLRWDRDGRRFTFLYNPRGHQALRVVAVDAATGEARALIDETSRTFVDYAHKLYYRTLDETNEILWMSERDGWNHLYLIDARTGAVKNAVTRGPWVVRGVELVDERARQVWFRLSGLRPDEDPYHVHYARVGFDGTGMLVLTVGDGTHRIEFSPDRRFFVDTYSRVDLPPLTELRRSSDGELVCALEKADASALRATGWRPPERFMAKGRDGVTDIWGVIHRPSNFDPSRKYPVIEDIYAGPQGSHVPKSFREFREQQALAELGFIVVQIDGMGTSNRSKAFHDVCWKNLGDAGLPDRIAWIRAAAAKYPSLDLARVGITGVSAGAQSALRALLVHGDFYKAGVAFCGCHDNRMDKVWWNELWMGWPVGPHYAEQSNVTQAHRLQGKLLLVVAEVDHNVDPASTLQVANALIKADKDFELLVVPGADHGTGGAYGRRRMQDFFVRHLLGTEPRRP